MHKIAIIGGGASGFMAAITAAERLGKQAEITIFEKSKNLLSKVRISGGGRCNVTHDEANRTTFASYYPRGRHFMKKAFSRFDMLRCVEWFEQRGVRLKTEADGRMFPTTDDSATIVQCLLSAAKKAGVHIRTSMGLSRFEPIVSSENGEKTDNFPSKRQFLLHFQNGEKHEADSLLLATGGHPKLVGYDWLTEHGIAIEPPVPSLFTFNAPGCPLRDLAGIAVPHAEASILGTKLSYEGPILLTHWGFSGPAILKLSAFGAQVLAEKNYQFELKINWLPEWKQEALQHFLKSQKEEQAKRNIGNYPLFDFPQRLWQLFLLENEIQTDSKWADIPNKALNRLADALTNSRFPIHGKSTFKEEFVTAGGVELHQINPKTMQHKSLHGLFFSGELLNIDGITGGFNFQAAWTTGYVAGMHL